ncbi:MAG: vitamin K epoxide reductase family protein [Akkermansiaceae bacterium]
MKPATRWILFALSVAALLLSLWLTIQKWTGNIDGLVGCGSGSGCSNVLGSKWSMVMGYIPVSFFSCLLYLAMIISLWMRGDWVIWLRCLFAWMLLAAAVWFIGLQFFILHMICPYCMVMHGLGIGIGLIALVATSGSQYPRYGLLRTLLPALVLVGILALVQHYGPAPDTHRLEKSSTDMLKSFNSASTDIHAAATGRLVSFMGDAKSYRVESLPHLGSSDAKHVIVKYFDYTCEACLETHDYLDTLMMKYPDQFAVIVLAVPLERSCNLHMPVGLKDHPNACKLARLSLRVWKAQPEVFAEFHRHLFDCCRQPYEVAEAIAYSLVDPDKLNAVDGPWVEAVLQQNITDYASLARDTPVLPKLLIKGSVLLNGKTKDSETLEHLLRKQLLLER